MNVIKLYGGLGNQLFQYALGQSQKDNGINVCYENTWYTKPENHYRPYCLDKFNTKVQLGLFKSNQKTLNEVSLNYMNDILFTKVDNCNFYGYWQHPRYFTSILSTLKKEFQVKKEFYTKEYKELKEKITNTNSISLHVRRGDYVQINGHHLLPLEYYDKAFVKILEQTGINVKVFIFSDDLSWCKQNLGINDNLIYVDQPEYLSFDLMRLCKHNIIANSTFSWWSAYLNDNPDKIVVSPDQWRLTKEGQSIVSKDILKPEGWQIISLKTDWYGK